MEGIIVDIQLNCDTNSQGSFYLPPEKANTIGITHSTKKILKFGIQSQIVNVQLSQGLPKNEASLSSTIIEKLKIPIHCQFEMKHINDEILVGPFIGLLACHHERSLKKYLPDLLDYLLDYHEIQGAILAFSLENVDKENLTVSGYLYNPVTKSWNFGKFPYPSSIFIMTRKVPTAWIDHFKSVIGDTIFNDFYFNKWVIHQIMASSAKLKKYLPHTILYKEPNDLFHFFKKYPKVMMKSVNGSKIYKIERNQNGLVFINPKKNKSKVMQDIDQAYSLFNEYFKEGEFIIQEAIELLTTHDRTIDFRVIMVKNESGLWKSMGMFARQGKPGAVLSNIYPFVELGKETLQEVWDFSHVKVSMLLKEINQVAQEAVQVIDQYGVHFANASVDIKIDADGGIWVLDIQHCHPSHEIALVAGYPDIYYGSLKNNMLYAKKLAGFTN